MMEGRTTTPANQLRLTTQVKCLEGNVSLMYYNIKDATTIELTLRIQGGMKGESFCTSDAADERQIKRRTSDLCSEISDINDIKLSDITEHLKREVDNATKKSNEQRDTWMKAFLENTLGHMQTVVQLSNEMMAQTALHAALENEHVTLEYER